MATFFYMDIVTSMAATKSFFFETNSDAHLAAPKKSSYGRVYYYRRRCTNYGQFCLARRPAAAEKNQLQPQKKIFPAAEFQKIIPHLVRLAYDV